MTQEQLKTKVSDLQKVLANAVAGARAEIGRRQQEIQQKQQELDAFIKSAQKNVDQIEGKVQAYTEMLDGEKTATAPEPVVIGGEAKEVPVEVLSKEAV